MKPSRRFSYASHASNLHATINVILRVIKIYYIFLNLTFKTMHDNLNFQGN